jgi:hypothetical protein
MRCIFWLFSGPTIQIGTLEIMATLSGVTKPSWGVGTTEEAYHEEAIISGEITVRCTERYFVTEQANTVTTTQSGAKNESTNIGECLGTVGRRIS